MRILGNDKFNEALLRFTNDQGAFKSWYCEVENAVWKTPHEVKERYPRLSPLGSNQYYFDIKGNTYRIEVLMHFESQLAIIKWIGTHAEYDKRNKKMRGR